MIGNSVEWEVAQAIEAIEAAKQNLKGARTVRTMLNEYLYSVDADLAFIERDYKRIIWLFKVLDDEEKLAVQSLDTALKIMGREPGKEGN